MGRPPYPVCMGRGSAGQWEILYIAVQEIAGVGKALFRCIHITNQYRYPDPTADYPDPAQARKSLHEGGIIMVPFFQQIYRAESQV